MGKPKTVTKCIIDADIVAYRAAAGTEWKIDPDWVPPNNVVSKQKVAGTTYIDYVEDGVLKTCEVPMVRCTVRDTEEKVDLLMNYIVGETVVFPADSNLECYLTGAGNFRFDVAKTAPYKGNRKDVPKPSNLPEARGYLQHKWGAIISEGEEADDLIGIASARGDPETTVVCTIDKDMMQLPCWNFNFVKNEWTCIGVEDGNKFFYTQILTGDSADHILGLYRIGPKKAEKMLEGLTTEKELYDKCIQAYKDHPHEKGDPYERVLENARLLWLRRYEGQWWEPPE